MTLCEAMEKYVVFKSSNEAHCAVLLCLYAFNSERVEQISVNIEFSVRLAVCFGIW